MRGAHDDAIPVGQDGVEGIVVIEGVAPHGRPEVVGLHSQQELEYFFVKEMVEATEFFSCPAGETGCFIIDEEAPVFYSGVLAIPCVFTDIDLFLSGYGDICPPVPGGYAHLSGQFEDPVGGSPSVAAGDHEGLTDAFEGMGDRSQGECFPFPADAVADEVIHDPVPVQAADDDEVGGGGRYFVNDLWQS